jgi:signal transduction histidine kinase
MYVFALDKHGKYLAFGGNATKVGSRVQDIPGVDGEGLIRAIVDQCEQGPGWVEYQITNPTSKKIQPKMSYVEALDGIYVGCGVYASLV